MSDNVTENQLYPIISFIEKASQSIIDRTNSGTLHVIVFDGKGNPEVFIKHLETCIIEIKRIPGSVSLPCGNYKISDDKQMKYLSIKDKLNSNNELLTEIECTCYAAIAQLRHPMNYKYAMHSVIELGQNMRLLASKLKDINNDYKSILGEIANAA